ncbi:MAG: ferrous iron transport protein B [Candidatus Midichloria mitochondrii]|nr:ferrous iron transport protein B [Candidatus Midichloria mitochondrii]
MKKICIVGNPNSGKSTLFNLLTSSQTRVGNWSGVTVEAHSKSVVIDNKGFEFFDLPGAYSLREGTTLDEKETTNFLLHTKYDAILNLIDITSLERSLNLTLQLLELGRPVVLILNKLDLVQSRQALVLKSRLASLLNCPVLVISAKKKGSLGKLGQFLSALDLSQPWNNRKFLDFYPADLIKIFEQEETTFYEFLKKIKSAEEELSVWLTKQQLIDKRGPDLDLFLIELRYEAVKKVLSALHTQIVRKPNKSDFIDKFLLNKFIGLPFFLLMMYLMFYFSIEVGGTLREPFEDIAEKMFVYTPLALLGKLGMENQLFTTLIYGIGNGIKTVAEFIPLIACLYFFISALEESGYLARATFVMNRFLKKLGLEGKSLIPLIIGFGCNVPAIMSSRIIKNKANRLAVILATPFMSCSARLTVFLILGSIFFKDHVNDIIFLLYLIGMVFGIISILVVRKFNFNQKANNFLIEVPDYQLPKISTVLHKTWHKTKDFVLGAGQTIIMVCFVVQLMNSFSLQGFIKDNKQDSILVIIGKSITPILKPMGITEENWPASVGIVTGLLAKEVIIGTLNSLYMTNSDIPKQGIIDFATDNEVLKDQAINQIHNLFHTNLSAFCYMVFILLYFPCFSVFASIQKELSLLWAVISTLWSTIIAYTCAVFLYQLGTYAVYDKISILPMIVSISLSILIFFTLVININRETKDAV